MDEAYLQITARTEMPAFDYLTYHLHVVTKYTMHDLEGRINSARIHCQ